MTGAWERTTRTTFYLQAEGAASMHCPALGEASTLTAGARLHVGYDSRVALTWSVAPVDWPPMDAFGRLALCAFVSAVRHQTTDHSGNDPTTTTLLPLTHPFLQSSGLAAHKP